MDPQASEIATKGEASGIEKQQHGHHSHVVPGTSSSSGETGIIHVNTDDPACTYVTNETGEESNVTVVLNVDEDLEDFTSWVDSNYEESSSSTMISVKRMEKCETPVKNNRKVDVSPKKEGENTLDNLTKTKFRNNSCFFCKTPLKSGLKVMHIVLNNPLPSSSLAPLSLLECFGMPVPTLSQTDLKGFTLVDVCGMCYVVLLDCDVLYPHLHSVISKIIEVWPDRLKGKKTLSLNVSFLDSERNKCKLSSGKHRNKLGCNKPFVPDLQFSFSYSRKPHLIPKSCKQYNPNNTDEDGEASARSVDLDASNKVSVEEIFSCGFCGMTFSCEQDWKTHLSTTHKIVERWLSYDLQIVLKTHISEEVCGNDVQGRKSKEGERPPDGDVNECRCAACDGEFYNRNELIDHLQDFHNMNMEIYDNIISDDTNSPPKERYSTELETFEGDELSDYLSDNNMSCDDEVDLDDIKYETAETHNSATSVTDRNEEMIFNSWLCKICYASYRSKGFLKKHINKAHPHLKFSVKNKLVREGNTAKPKTRIAKKEPLKESSTEATGEFCPKPKAKRKRKYVSQITKNLEYCVVLKNDGQGGVTDCRVKLREDSEENKEPCSSHISNENLDKETEGIKDENLTCGICGEEFESHILIAEHICPNHANTTDNNKGNEVVFLECTVCNRRLLGKQAMSRHLSYAHGYSIKGTPKKFKCKMCKFQCQKPSDLNKHVKQVHRVDMKPPVKCFVCGKTYSACYIAKHISVIHGTLENKKYSCKFCNMKYHNASYLRDHMYKVHANTKWKCQICDLEFDKYHRLMMHKVKVHQTFVHKCPDCDKTYKRKCDLTNHRKRTHETRMRISCGFCSKTFLEKSKLRPHLVSVHGVPWENTLSRRYARHFRENNLLQKPSEKVKRKVDRLSGENIQKTQVQKKKRKTRLPKADTSPDSSECEEDHMDNLGEEEYAGSNRVQYNPQETFDTSRGNVLTSYGRTNVNTETGEYSIIEIREAVDSIVNLGAMTSAGNSGTLT